jgi:hypothetical protein
MVVNLLETYGIVPQTVYPESLHSSLSSPLNALLKTKLREHALILRHLSSSLRSEVLSEETVMSTLRVKKEELMKEIYIIMSATLGVPPKPNEAFAWEYYNVDGKTERWEGTATEYYKAFASKAYSVRDTMSLSMQLLIFYALGSHRIPSRLSTTLVMNIPSCIPLTNSETSGAAVLSFVSCRRLVITNISDHP